MLGAATPFQTLLIGLAAAVTADLQRATCHVSTVEQLGCAAQG
jgi:hypothetical protein